MTPGSAGILARAVGGDAPAGSTVEAVLDRIVLSGARGPATLVEVQRRGRPWSSEHLLFAMDFQAPEVEVTIPRSRALCRELATTYGLRHVFDLNQGVGSHVVLEDALVLPGQLIAGSGRCLGVLGGIGALAFSRDPEDLAAAILSGRLALTVPGTVRVGVTGKAPRQLAPWDLAIAIAEALGPELMDCIIEIEGGGLGIDFRVALCGLLTERGAAAALVAADEVVSRFYKARGIEAPAPEDGTADPGPVRITVDLETVGAVTAPDYRGRPEPLPATSGAAVQGVFIGGCYGGRYEDLTRVAEVLKRGGQVHPEVRLVISPASLETTRACLAAGFIEIFLNAGAMITVPGGGPGSAGGGAIFGEGERIASTAEYHRHLDPGQGVPEVRILGPAAAAVAAVAGRLTDPASYLA